MALPVLLPRVSTNRGSPSTLTTSFYQRDSPEPRTTSFYQGNSPEPRTTSFYQGDSAEPFTAPLRECLNIAQGHLAAFRSTNQRRAKINFGKFLAEKTIYDAGIGHRSTAATFPIDSCPIRYISCRLRAEKIENNSADKHRPLVYRGLAATCQSTVSSFQESECNVSGAMGAEYEDILLSKSRSVSEIQPARIIILSSCRAGLL